MKYVLLLLLAVAIPVFGKGTTVNISGGCPVFVPVLQGSTVVNIFNLCETLSMAPFDDGTTVTYTLRNNGPGGSLISGVINEAQFEALKDKGFIIDDGFVPPP